MEISNHNERINKSEKKVSRNKNRAFFHQKFRSEYHRLVLYIIAIKDDVSELYAIYKCIVHYKYTKYFYCRKEFYFTLQTNP